MLCSAPRAAFALFSLLGISNVLAGGQASHGDLAQIIKALQAHISPRSPMAALAKRGENVLSSFESLETQLNSETSAITSLCSSLNYATSASQRSAIGAEINTRVSNCATIVSQCSGGFGGGSSQRPQPSGRPTTSSGYSSCSAAAGAFTGCVSQLHTCATEIAAVWSRIPQHQESIAASFSSVDEECNSLLESAETYLPGVTSLTASYTASIRSSTSSSGLTLSTLYNTLNHH